MAFRTLVDAVEAGAALRAKEGAKRWAEGQEGKVHVTEVGDCHRRVVLRRLGAKETNPEAPRHRAARDLGDAHHGRLNEFAAAAGVLLAADRPGASLTVSDDLLVAHPDALVALAHGVVVVEWKTVSAAAWERAVREGKPMAAHRDQLNAYLGLMGMDRGSLGYCNRETGEVTEFPIRFSEGAYATTRADARMLMGEIAKAKVGGKAPSVPQGYAHDAYPCSRRDGKGVVLCVFWDACWGNAKPESIAQGDVAETALPAPSAARPSARDETVGEDEAAKAGVFAL